MKMAKTTRQHLLGFLAGVLFSAVLMTGGVMWFVKDIRSTETSSTPFPIMIMRDAEAKKYVIMFSEEEIWHFDKDRSEWMRQDQSETSQIVGGEMLVIHDGLPKE